MFGFKCFLAPSGVDEFPPLPVAELERYLAELAGFGGMMIVHAEDGDALERAPEASGREYADFLASRPRGVENLAIAELIEAARHTGAAVHLLHLSSSDAVPMLRSARRDGIACHRRDVPALPRRSRRRRSPRAPPVQVLPAHPRGRQPRGPLGGARAAATSTCVVSDHSPCVPELKGLDAR